MTDNMTLPLPHYGPSETKFPGTLFTTFDGTLRIIRDTDTLGVALWRVQRRAEKSTTCNSWGNLLAAKGRDALLKGLAQLSLSDPAMLSYVHNQLPHRAR